MNLEEIKKNLELLVKAGLVERVGDNYTLSARGHEYIKLPKDEQKKILESMVSRMYTCKLCNKIIDESYQPGQRDMICVDCYKTNET